MDFPDGIYNKRLIPLFPDYHWPKWSISGSQSINSGSSYQWDHTLASGGNFIGIIGIHCFSWWKIPMTASLFFEGDLIGYGYCNYGYEFKRDIENIIVWHDGETITVLAENDSGYVGDFVYIINYFRIFNYNV